MDGMYDSAEQKILEGFMQAIYQAEHKHDNRLRDIEKRLEGLERQFGQLMAQISLRKLYIMEEDNE